MSIATYYRGHPNPPKPTQRARLGANAIITCGGKILLEKRSDCDTWGLVGGGVKNYETPLQGICREVYEEIGVRVDKSRFQKLKVYGEPGRIAAYRDGTVWRMVIVAFALELPENQPLRISKESKELRYFTREELKDIPIVVTHSDIVEEWFLNKETS